VSRGVAEAKAGSGRVSRGGAEAKAGSGRSESHGGWRPESAHGTPTGATAYHHSRDDLDSGLGQAAATGLHTGRDRQRLMSGPLRPGSAVLAPGPRQSHRAPS